MIIIEASPTRQSEREYVFGVVFGEFMGLPWRMTRGERDDVRITVQGQPGELTLPDVLFRTPDAHWRAAASMPARPLPVWDSRELGVPVNVIGKKVPIIYGDRAPAALLGWCSIRLPIDVFGAAFFMLSRYEEVVTSDRDEHDRFPAWASLAYQEDFLQRPIIDEYVEILWSTMKVLWPWLQRRERQVQIRVSHDVDRPARYGFGGVRALMRRMGGDLVKRRNLAAALGAPWIRMRSRSHLHPNDPYNTFDWIMDQSERHGFTSAFYFLCGRSDEGKDADYEPEHPAIRDLMRRIHARGHEIGLHPSYNTYRNGTTLVAEADRLRRICDAEGIYQEAWGGRMHYLRWETPTTMRLWEQANMTYDSTLGYADHAGFRCGTCKEYPAYDLVSRTELRLQIRPLIAMERSVLSENYMGLGCSETAADKLSQLRNACGVVRGEFTLLWHNSEFPDEQHQALYLNTIGG